MTGENKRKHNLHFRVTDIEKTYIEKKFETSKQKNMSDFLRKTVVFSKVIPYRENDFTDLRRQFSGACNNINQIAFQANKSRNVSPQSLSEINEVKEILIDILKAIYSLEDTVKMDLKN
jgi:hypothetical protein